MIWFCSSNKVSNKAYFWIRSLWKLSSLTLTKANKSRSFSSFFFFSHVKFLWCDSFVSHSWYCGWVSSCVWPSLIWTVISGNGVGKRARGGKIQSGNLLFIALQPCRTGKKENKGSLSVQWFHKLRCLGSKVNSDDPDDCLTHVKRSLICWLSVQSCEKSQGRGK